MISRRNVLLPVVVADRLAKIAALVGEEETFVRIQIQPVSADPRIDGIEQRPRFPQGADGATSCAARPLDSSSAMRCSLIRNPRRFNKANSARDDRTASLIDIGLVRRGYSSSGGAEAYLLRLAVRPARARLPADSLRHQRLAGRSLAVWRPCAAWTPRHRLEFARAFQRARKPGQTVLSLDRVPGCDVFRAGDGVHAAWLQRRSRFEPALEEPAAVLEFEARRTSRAWSGRFSRLSGSAIANSRMVADGDRPLARFPGRKDPRRSQWDRRQRSRASPARRLGVASRFRSTRFAFCLSGTGWERKGLRFAIEAVESLGGERVLLVAGRGNANRYRSARARFLGVWRTLPRPFRPPMFSPCPRFTILFPTPAWRRSPRVFRSSRPRQTDSRKFLTPGVHGEVVEPGDVKALAERS